MLHLHQTYGKTIHVRCPAARASPSGRASGVRQLTCSLGTLVAPPSVLQTWQYDKHPDLPLGPPQLMMSYTHEYARPRFPALAPALAPLTLPSVPRRAAAPQVSGAQGDG